MRTVPPYFHQASVWIDLLLYFEWKQVIMIHSMDEEGRTILSRFQALAESVEIKVHVHAPVFIYYMLILIGLFSFSFNFGEKGSLK